MPQRQKKMNVSSATKLRTAAVIIVFIIFAWREYKVLELTDKHGVLSAENVRLRVIHSTIDKLTHRLPPDYGDESGVIERAAREYMLCPVFLWSLRRTENGRELYEMGCNNISADVKRRAGVADWQYYQASQLIARQQTAYIFGDVKRAREFIEFLSHNYASGDDVIRRRWVRNLTKIYEEERAK